jgi:antibiotic biosynthesis monooxygenase (ABM) superfamily enzyme
VDVALVGVVTHDHDTLIGTIRHAILVKIALAQRLSRWMITRLISAIRVFVISLMTSTSAGPQIEHHASAAKHVLVNDLRAVVLLTGALT